MRGIAHTTYILLKANNSDLILFAYVVRISVRTISVDVFRMWEKECQATARMVPTSDIFIDVRYSRDSIQLNLVILLPIIRARLNGNDFVQTYTKGIKITRFASAVIM